MDSDSEENEREREKQCGKFKPFQPNQYAEQKQNAEDRTLCGLLLLLCLFTFTVVVWVQLHRSLRRRMELLQEESLEEEDEDGEEDTESDEERRA